jgi:site-specific recombinase XerD
LFERLFRRKSIIRRHQEAPFAEERSRYLAFKAEVGAARITLCATANYLFSVASCIALKDPTPISRETIETAASGWAHSAAGGRKAASRQRFTSVACSWLAFLGRLASPSRESAPYGDLVSAFVQYMAKERGFAAKTIAGYSWSAKHFLHQLVFHGKTIQKLDIRSVEDVLTSLGDKGYTRRGIQTYAQGLRAFLRYGEECGACPAGIAAAIVVPRAFRQEKLPAGPSWVDVQRLLASADTKKPKDIRDYAILLLLAVYGLRVDEVRQLQLEDFDWEREVVLIRSTKQRHERVYPLSQSLGNAIVRYLKEVRPRSKDRALFLRTRSPHRSLGAGGLWPIVGRRIRRLGILVQHPGPHCLRHACAARLLSQGLSFKEIGDHLGHRSPESTRIYAKVDLASLREVGNLDLGGLL